MLKSICIKDSGANILLSKSIYDKEAVIAAAYWNMAKYAVEIQDTESNYQVSFSPREGLSSDEHTMKCDMEAFYSNVLDEQMRLVLESRTGKIRELIVKHAFSPIDLKNEVGA